MRYSCRVRTWRAAVLMLRRRAWNCSPERVREAAAHGGARVASEGFAPHSHRQTLYVVGGALVLLDPIYRRDGPGRIRGLLDGPKGTGPLSHRNFDGWAGFEGPVRHALTFSMSLT